MNAQYKMQLSCKIESFKLNPIIQDETIED